MINIGRFSGKKIIRIPTYEPPEAKKCHSVAVYTKHTAIGGDMAR
jgi:hypothetical protein